MSVTFNVTPDALNGLVEFDSPFRVASDGSVCTDVPSVYAPELYDEEIISDSWEFASTGYTGQYGYAGPIMHASEQLSGGLARDILASPGVYVVVASEILDCDDDCDDECTGEHEPAGWAVLRMV